MSMTAVPISIVFVRAPTAARSGNGEPSWRAKLVHAEIRAIEAQFFGGYRELDRLQKRIRRCVYVRVRRWCPVPEGEKADLFHATYLGEKAAPASDLW